MSDQVTLQRVSNWEDVWVPFMVIQRRRPFIWGQDDCMLLAGRNVEVLTGVDFYSEHVGKYSTEKEALAYLKTLGFSAPEDMIASHLPEAPVALAQRGDIVLNDQGNLGVSMSGSALFLSDDKPVLIPTLNCLKAWKVG